MAQLSSNAVDVVTVDTAEGRQMLWEALPGVVMIRYEGCTSVAQFERAAAFLDGALARYGRVVFITDAEECGAYEPRVRDMWTAWRSTNRSRIEASYFLAASSFLIMGAQIVNMVSGNNTRFFRQHEELEEVLRTRYPGIDLSPMHARRRELARKAG